MPQSDKSVAVCWLALFRLPFDFVEQADSCQRLVRTLRIDAGLSIVEGLAPGRRKDVVAEPKECGRLGAFEIEKVMAAGGDLD